MELAITVKTFCPRETLQALALGAVVIYICVGLKCLKLFFDVTY